MKSPRIATGGSLRTKLVLSFVAVALGATIVLAISVFFAVQASFEQERIAALQVSASIISNNILRYYDPITKTWVSDMQDQILRGGNLLAIKGADHTLLTPPNAGELTVTNADTSTINNALEQSLSGQTVTGYLSGNGDGSFSGDYISEPLYLNGQNTGPIIGSFVIGEAKLAPSGYTPGVFLANVNQAIVLSGLIVAIAVVIFSLLLAHGITKPLERLTLAAEQVKSGNYAERVPDPVSQDEMGRLAQTFNEMANRIEFDVTELRRQEQLRRDMIANIAHDLATPLTAIQGFSEALADNVIEAPMQRQETAQLIGREVQRMRRLVGDMQHMTLLESRQTRLDLAPLDLHALAEETLEVIRPECEQAGIELRNELSRELPPLLADSDRITQVLLNLLDNARRYTPSGGSITLGAEAGANQVTIWVADTGSGIGKDDLSHIFERFYRADRSRTGRTGGSGLGLSIVKAIITAHNGTIQATSQPRQGTKISFTLPVSKTNITRPLEVSEVSHP